MMEQKRWKAACFTNSKSWVSHLFNLTKLDLIILLLSISFVIIFIFHVQIVGCRKMEKGPINIEKLIFSEKKILPCLVLILGIGYTSLAIAFYVQ